MSGLVSRMGGTPLGQVPRRPEVSGWESWCWNVGISLMALTSPAARPDAIVRNCQANPAVMGTHVRP
jgi:hypothetical protein